MTPRTSRPFGAREVGEAARVLRVAPAPRHADHDVDQDLADPAVAAASIVSSESTATVTRAAVGARQLADARASGAQRLVGEQEIVTEAGRSHAFHLAWRRAAEPGVAVCVEPPRERGRLPRLDVRTQPRTGPCVAHRVDVVFEGLAVDEEGGRRQIIDAHVGAGWHIGQRSILRLPTSMATSGVPHTPHTSWWYTCRGSAGVLVTMRLRRTPSRNQRVSVSQIDFDLGSIECAPGGQGMDPVDEQDLGPEHVADAGDHGLIEQQRADRLRGSLHRFG